MPIARFGIPSADEYASYYARYIQLVPTDDLLGFMRDQIAEVTALFSGLSEEKAGAPYAPGKWTIKEVLGHIIDTERAFQYRALSIGRLDPTPLPGFDQDVWNPNGGFNDCTLAMLVEQWVLVRKAYIAFLESLPQAALLRTGRASDNPFSVRALCYISPGHVAYHVNILKERYL
jgi:DinB superfamily